MRAVIQTDLNNYPDYVELEVGALGDRFSSNKMCIQSQLIRIRFKQKQVDYPNLISSFTTVLRNVSSIKHQICTLYCSLTAFEKSA